MPSRMAPVRSFSDPSEYAPSEATSMSNDTMVTWRPQESVAGSQDGRNDVATSAAHLHYSRSLLSTHNVAPPTQNHPFGTPESRMSESASPGHVKQNITGMSGLGNSGSTPQLVEPEPFDGTRGTQCSDFVRSIRQYAFNRGVYNDPQWIANYAATRLSNDALVWHILQPADVRNDWDRLERALCETFYYRPAADGTSFTPGSSPGATSSSSATFLPAMTGSSSSSGNALSPPILSPNASTPLSTPSEHQQTPSQSLRHLRNMSQPSRISIGLESSSRPQCGQLQLVDDNGRRFYVKVGLNGRGGCVATADRSKALRNSELPNASYNTRSGVVH
ncbi:hypothetical protein FRB90_007867 [Tulasnella sp. 427]|nr:hypothetical protein FRB90_007867 [Tulasnella sp. 427]